MSTYPGKRALDLALAVPMLALSLPIQAVVAMAVRRRLGSPVLFRQARPGLHGRPFVMVKFRTMRDVDASVGLVTDDERMTPLGRTLRATSLDELPTLWNVVRGDMSLVGPRPLLMHYLDLYTPEQARRHDVPPGLTGPAQVNGRNTTTWDRRFEYDLEYVGHNSLRGDVRLLAQTIGKVLRREGVAAEGVSTMHEFVGPRGEHRP